MWSVLYVLAARIPSPLPGSGLQFRSEKIQGQLGRTGDKGLEIPATQRAESGGLKVQGQPGQLNETLSQNKVYTKTNKQGRRGFLTECW